MGLLSDPSSGMAKAMGGIGAGLRYPNTLNVKNPASYSTVDTLTFIADLGFALQNGNFNENGVSVNARNAFIDHMAMQFRILPKVGMTVGFMPFANVGYGFSKTEPVRRDEDGEITSTITNSGSGGVRQFLGGLGLSERRHKPLHQQHILVIRGSVQRKDIQHGDVRFQI